MVDDIDTVGFSSFDKELLQAQEKATDLFKVIESQGDPSDRCQCQCSHKSNTIAKQPCNCSSEVSHKLHEHIACHRKRGAIRLFGALLKTAVS